MGQRKEEMPFATATLPNSPTLAADAMKRCHNLVKHKMTLLEVLKPNFRTNYLLGGSHRCWIIESARRTAGWIVNDIATDTAAAPSYTHIEPGDTALCANAYTLPIPMPDQWGGVRPEETCAFKDFRHFENALRYFLAEKDIFYNAGGVKVAEDHSSITIIAQPAILAAMGGWITLTPETTPDLPATIISPPYEQYCQNLEALMSGTAEPTAEPTMEDPTN
jgi:hypothetical protein